MKFRVKKSDIKGSIEIPGSKSHTIRALFLAALADKKSKVLKPLISDDTKSALNTCRAIGGKVDEIEGGYSVEGLNGRPKVPDNVIDVGNSGTTLNISLGTSSLIEGYTIFTGDHQIRSRPVGPLIEALNCLGAQIFCAKNNGKPPVVVKGKAKGGETKIDAVSSQFLSSLLINCPLMEKDTTIEVTRLFEKPYVDITLLWLDKLGIKYENHDYKSFKVFGNQSYKSFTQVIPADFSSATFFLVLAAITGGELELKNLDMTDPQGDKLVIKILEEMGSEIRIKKESIIVKGKKLTGREIDMNSIPDALPAMAVAGCFAEGTTKLLNVPQARLKETDRIKVMFEELTKMGADIRELDDGLKIRQSRLKPCIVNGHHDHRIVMALAVAGLNLGDETLIETAEAAAVTFPDFHELIKKCNGNITVEK